MANVLWNSPQATASMVQMFAELGDWKRDMLDGMFKIKDRAEASGIHIKRYRVSEHDYRCLLAIIGGPRYPHARLEFCGIPVVPK